MGANKSFDRFEYMDLPQLSAVALNATAATRTITLDMEGWNYAVFDIVFTRSAATTVTITPVKLHPYGSTNEFSLPVIDPTTSVITYGYPAHSYTTSSTGKFTMAVPVPPGSKSVKYLFGGASADGSDLVTVYVTKVASE